MASKRQLVWQTVKEAGGDLDRAIAVASAFPLVLGAVGTLKGYGIGWAVAGVGWGLAVIFFVHSFRLRMKLNATNELIEDDAKAFGVHYQFLLDWAAETERREQNLEVAERLRSRSAIVERVLRAAADPTSETVNFLGCGPAEIVNDLPGDLRAQIVGKRIPQMPQNFASWVDRNRSVLEEHVARLHSEADSLDI